MEFVFGFEDNFSVISPELITVSKSWNLIWLSAWILDNLLDSLSNLKLISSNLFVNSWNWFSISDNFKRCLVSTSSELWSKELFDKELFCSEEGQMISWFNVQCYYSFSFLTYDSIIKNGYPPEKIVMGHESGQFTKETFQNALDTVKKILQEYPTMGGVYDWEYLNSPPDTQDPSLWCKLMKRCSENNS